MRIKSISATILLLALGIGIGLGLGRVSAATGGSLDPAGPPTGSGAVTSYTLNDIWNRLNDGTSGSQNAFVEPADGPTGGTMHDLNEIMSKAPVIDDANGATTAQVQQGRTFWGLSSGAWGLQTGSAALGSDVSGAEGSRTFTIPDGFYSGSRTATANDADLATENIKTGVTILGVTGSYPLAGVAKSGADALGGYVFLPGEDGYSPRGVDLPIPRFTDNSNGTITDNLTGLVWLKNANCPNSGRSWLTALDDIVQLNTDGTMNGNDCGDTSNAGSHQTDWRLPNVRELSSLVHYGYFDLALSNTTGTGQWSNGDPFTNVNKDMTATSGIYWTNTTYAGQFQHAWYISFSHGHVFHNFKRVEDGGSLYYIWPVRGGQ